MATQSNPLAQINHTRRLKRGTWLAAGLLATLLNGCSDTEHHDHDPLFSDHEEAHDLSALIHTQNANGAVADGTLYSGHFTRDQLNSLGYQKLDLMLSHCGAMPMTVYLNVPEDDQAEARRMAVGQYLRQRGLKVEDIKFAMGPNPAAMGNASDGIKGLSDLDAAAAGGGAGGASGGSSNGSSEAATSK